MTPYQFSPDKHYLSSIVLEVDFFNKKNTTTDPFNSDDMAKEFSMQFCKQAFTVGMQCVFNFADKKLLSINIKVCLRKVFCNLYGFNFKIICSVLIFKKISRIVRRPT